MRDSRRAGDIFIRSPEQPGVRVTFAEAFPDIESLDAAVAETGEGNQGLGIRRFTRLSAREFVNCSNHRCSGKGFSLGELLRAMTRGRRTRLSQARSCLSHEESGRRCPNRFQVDIELRYKNGNAA